MAGRQPRVVILAGKNGSGKTTLARKLVSKHRAPFVIAPSCEWGKWGDPKKLAIQAVRDGSDALVLDDADAYLPANPDQFWIKLFSTNRHLGLDVLLLSRRPQALPMWAVAAAHSFYLLPLGLRETSWCQRQFGQSPPESGHTPKVIVL